jgi:hypothetical protein
MSMTERKQIAERSVGAPICDPEGMAAILMIMDRVKMGPGTPGPGDEWRFPTGPMDETDGAEGSVTDPARAGQRVALLDRLTRRG